MQDEAILLSKEEITLSMEQQSSSIKGAIFQLIDQLKKLIDGLCNLRTIENDNYRHIITAVTVILSEKLSKDLRSMNSNQEDLISLLTL